MRIWVKRGLLLCSLAALCAMLSLATLAVGYIGEDRAVGAVLRHTGGRRQDLENLFVVLHDNGRQPPVYEVRYRQAAIRCTTPWTPKQGKSSTMGATGWATASPCRRTGRRRKSRRGIGRPEHLSAGFATSSPQKKRGGSHRSQAKSSSKTAHLNLDKQNCQCYNEANSK